MAFINAVGSSPLKASSSAETVNQDAADAAAEAPDAVIELMKRIFGTAKIVDYGLFGG